MSKTTSEINLKYKNFLSRFKFGFLRFLRQVKKEFRLLMTDKMNLLIALGLPPAIIMLFATMSTSASQIVPVRIVVVSYDSNTFVNQDNYSIVTTWDNYTEKYIDAVEESELLELVEFYDASDDDDEYAMEEARQRLKDGEIEVIVVIPVEFSEFLTTGYPGTIEIIPDTSNVIYIQDRLNAIQDSVNIFVEDNDLDPEYVIQEYEEYSIPADYNLRFNYNITLLFSFIIFGISNVLTILVVVQERPIARLLLTPVNKNEILLSKYVVYSLVLALQVLLVLISAMFNGLYLAGDLIDLYIALYLLGFTGISLG
ncbi:MAG: ABC transporter permease, partial [Promethearchaeota archaeon]